MLIKVPVKLADLIPDMPVDALRLYCYIITALGILQRHRAGNLLAINNDLLAKKLNINFESAMQYLIDKHLIKHRTTLSGGKSIVIATGVRLLPTEKDRLRRLR